MLEKEEIRVLRENLFSPLHYHHDNYSHTHTHTQKRNDRMPGLTVFFNQKMTTGSLRAAIPKLFGTRD